MADLEYTVGVNTRRAQASLNRLEKKTESTSEAFGRLKGALAGLAVGAFIQQAFQAAGAIDNISRATGIAIQTLVGFSDAFQAVGGTIDQSRDAISDFSQNLGDARLGAAELQQAFQQAGVSLDDLRSLSAETTFQKTIQGLSQMEDRSQAAFVAMRIFGESFKGIPIEDLNTRLGEAISSSEEAARAFETAGQSTRNLSQALSILRQEVVIALAPIAEFTNNLLESSEIVRQTIRAVTQLAVALGGLFILGKIGKALKGVALTGKAAFTTLGSAVKRTGNIINSIVISVSSFFDIFTNKGIRSMTTFGQRVGGAGRLLLSVGTRITALIPLIGQLATVFFVVETAIKALTGAGLLTWLGRASEQIEDLFSQSTRAGQALTALASAFSDTEQPRIQSTSPGRPGGETGERNLRFEQENKVVDALAAQKSAIDRIVAANRERNATTLENLRIQRDQVDMTDRQVAIQNNLLDFTRQYEQQIQALKDRRQDLMAEEEKNKEVIEQIDAAIKQVTQDYISQYPEVLRISQEVQNALAAEEARADAIERQQEAQRRVTSAVSQTNDFLVGLGESTEDMRRELLEMDMSPLERQISRIETQINRDAVNAIQNLYDELQEVDDPAARQRIENQIERIESAAAEAIESQSRLAQQSYEHQRSFARGWEQAFREYQDNATNAAKQAERVFETTTRGIEDTIVDFAKTGKFEFKGLVTDILETIFRSNIQQVIAQVFNPDNFSGDGILGSIGDILGIGGAGNPLAKKGENANNPLYVQEVSGAMSGGSGLLPGSPSIGGASGGLGGVIDSVKNAVGGIFGGNEPRQVSGIGSGAGLLPGAPSIGGVSSGIGGIFDTVKNAASGIGSLFGGFFATGGQIPPNRFGVVGERGPELVSGPANVTPMEGGMNVTLNINAVDAQSFKQLAAKDPEFIAALARKGSQAIPSRR